MQFQDVVRRRRMVRAYLPDRPVPTAARERILDNATRGPSAGFTQGFELLVLESSQERESFWAATTGPEPADDWLRRMRAAPLLIVCLSHEAAYRRRYDEADKRSVAEAGRQWAAPYWHMDTAMAALLMLQTAVDEGLGACFFGVPAARLDGLREAFGVPADRTPVGVVSVGYADPAHDRRSPSLRGRRRAREDVVHRGRWQG